MLRDSVEQMTSDQQTGKNDKPEQRQAKASKPVRFLLRTKNTTAKAMPITAITEYIPKVLPKIVT